MQKNSNKTTVTKAKYKLQKTPCNNHEQQQQQRQQLLAGKISKIV